MAKYKFTIAGFPASLTATQRIVEGHDDIVVDRVHGSTWAS